MKLNIEAIPPQGTPVRASLEDDWARKAATEAMEGGLSALEVDLRVNAVDHNARVRGEISAEIPTACDRCGAELRLRLEGPVDLLYTRQGAPGTEEVELSAEDLDLSWFDGQQLDMAQVLSEQLGLWLPARVVCGEPGVERLEPGDCEIPHQDEGPDLKPQNPFAVLKRSE